MSGLFQNTVTVYNRYTKTPINWQGGPPPSSSVAWEKVIIKNVMWKDKTLTVLSSDGKPFIAKTVSITIPLDKMETDKTYVEPKYFVADTGKWTLSQGDIIVFGECDKEITATYTTGNLRKEFKTMEITEISPSVEQDILPKWDIIGV